MQSLVDYTTSSWFRTRKCWMRSGERVITGLLRYTYLDHMAITILGLLRQVAEPVGRNAKYS
jgi:hypothetical protein